MNIVYYKILKYVQEHEGVEFEINILSLLKSIFTDVNSHKKNIKETLIYLKKIDYIRGYPSFIDNLVIFDKDLDFLKDDVVIKIELTENGRSAIDRHEMHISTLKLNKLTEDNIKKQKRFNILLIVLTIFTVGLSIPTALKDYKEWVKLDTQSQLHKAPETKSKELSLTSGSGHLKDSLEKTLKLTK